MFPVTDYNPDDSPHAGCPGLSTSALRFSHQLYKVMYINTPPIWTNFHKIYLLRILRAVLPHHWWQRIQSASQTYESYKFTLNKIINFLGDILAE